MSSNVFRWTQQLDNIASHATPGGYAKFNAMPWFSYLAFDIIGDLAFGAPFGSKYFRSETQPYNFSFHAAYSIL